MTATQHPDSEDLKVRDALAGLAARHGLDVGGGRMRRTSSRFCLGVEHGDYNGTELFGVGTDRFIWMAYKPNATRKCACSATTSPTMAWSASASARPRRRRQTSMTIAGRVFPLGVSYILGKAGYPLTRGFDAVLLGNIPGGGMSRSASLSINLILSFFDVQGVAENDGMKIVQPGSSGGERVHRFALRQTGSDHDLLCQGGNGRPLPPQRPLDHAHPLRRRRGRVPHRQPGHRHHAAGLGEIRPTRCRRSANNSPPWPPTSSAFPAWPTCAIRRPTAGSSTGSAPPKALFAGV